MYGRDVEGDTLTFGVSGALLMNALVMYDRQTDTLWSQFLGVAVDGELAGTELDQLGSSLTTWAAWREAHPDTLVLDQGGRRGDPYRGYYGSESTGVRGQTVEDARLGTKDLVLGLQLEGGAAKAYAFRDLSSTPVVNDEVGGVPLLVAFDAGLGSGATFSRALDGRTLTFEAGPTAAAGPTLLDRETGTAWSALTGAGLDGPLAGEQLEVLPSFAVFWFAWTDFHPGSPLYAPP